MSSTNDCSGNNLKHEKEAIGFNDSGYLSLKLNPICITFALHSALKPFLDKILPRLKPRNRSIRTERIRKTKRPTSLQRKHPITQKCHKCVAQTLRVRPQWAPIRRLTAPSVETRRVRIQTK